MTSIGNVATHIGLTERPGERAILMAVINGKVRHAYLGDALNVDVETAEALYAASGLFRDGSLTGNRGRSEENLTRVVWLPFDADLLDYMGCAPGSDEAAKSARSALQAELGAMPDDELFKLIGALRADLEETFAALHIPIHRLDYTGYGLCAYVYIDEADQTRIQDARIAHKRLVEAINQHFGDRLVDPQCSDAGTRVTRLPETYNRKGTIRRLVQTLVVNTGATCPLGHNPAAPRPMARAIASTGDGMSADDAAALIAAVAPSWSLGQRHAVALAVAGMLAKAGIPENQAVQIIEALSHTDGDVWTQAITEVHTTYRRARQGSPVAGFTQLQALIPSTALVFIDQLLDRYRQSTTATAGAVSIGMFEIIGGDQSKAGKTNDSDKLDLMPFGLQAPPEVCFSGWFKSYVDLVEPLCEAPSVFHLASGLALASGTFGRSVCARYVSKNIYGNTYIMLVGPAGTSRKDTAIEMALDIPNHRGPGLHALNINTAPFKQLTDVGSAEGLINVLSKTPNSLLYITEYQRLVRNAKRQSTSSIFPLLTAAWNAPRILENITKGNPLEAKFPYLSIVAAVQPGILAQEMQQEDIESGYATRWLFVPGDGKQDGLPEPDDIDENTAWKLYRTLLDIRKHYEAENGETRLSLSARAKERWIDWYQVDRKRDVDNEDEASMRSRLGIHVRKIALLYAATDGASVIDLQHLDPAIAFVEWCWNNTRVLMRGWGVSVWNQIENRIEKVLREHGAIMRKDLAYKCRGRRWSAREFSMVLDSMIKNGTVLSDAIGVLKWSA